MDAIELVGELNGEYCYPQNVEIRNETHEYRVSFMLDGAEMAIVIPKRDALKAVAHLAVIMGWKIQDQR